MRPTGPLLLMLALTGCAAAKPGFSPDAGANVPAQFKPFNGGTLQAGGQYTVSQEERALSCSKLTGSMQVIMSRLKDSASRPKPSGTAIVMQSTAKPFIGGGSNLDVNDEIKQARARLKAYNELLAEKKCKTLDIANV
jgi:hypothetical protein